VLGKYYMYQKDAKANLARAMMCFAVVCNDENVPHVERKLSGNNYDDYKRIGGRLSNYSEKGSISYMNIEGKTIYTFGKVGHSDKRYPPWI
jgi:hypothetical protein